MKKRDLLSLWQGLNQLDGLNGVKFAYGIAKNINIIRPEIEALDKSLEISKEYADFEQERIKLAVNLADKDEKGEPKIENNQYVIKDKAKFEKEFEKLKKSNKELIDKRQKQVDDYNKLLEEETDIKFSKIKLVDVPEGITTSQMNNLFPIIDE